MKADDYIYDLEQSLNGIRNNSNYLSYFEDMYIPKKIKNYLDEIIMEIEKTEKMVEEVSSNTVELETGSNT